MLCHVRIPVLGRVCDGFSDCLCPSQDFTDESNFVAEFRDTWAFLDNRVKDAFDLKKTMQEVALHQYSSPHIFLD